MDAKQILTIVFNIITTLLAVVLFFGNIYYADISHIKERVREVENQTAVNTSSITRLKKSQDRLINILDIKPNFHKY